MFPLLEALEHPFKSFCISVKLTLLIGRAYLEMQFGSSVLDARIIPGEKISVLIEKTHSKAFTQTHLPGKQRKTAISNL